MTKRIPKNSKYVGIEKIVLNSADLKEFLEDPMLYPILEPFAEKIYKAIPPSEGNVDNRIRDRRYKGVVGRYRSKFNKKTHANDGRVAIDVGVEDANRTFFRLGSLQKAIRSTGAKLKYKRRKKG